MCVAGGLNCSRVTNWDQKKLEIQLACWLPWTLFPMPSCLSRRSQEHPVFLLLQVFPYRSLERNSHSSCLQRVPAVIMKVFWAIVCLVVYGTCITLHNTVAEIPSPFTLLYFQWGLTWGNIKAQSYF